MSEIGIGCFKRPLVIAGPCSAENREQLLSTAVAVKETGVKFFRAGLWKPRTKPGGFEGVGAAGLVEGPNQSPNTFMVLVTIAQTFKQSISLRYILNDLPNTFGRHLLNTSFFILPHFFK